MPERLLYRTEGKKDFHKKWWVKHDWFTLKTGINLNLLSALYLIPNENKHKKTKHFLGKGKKHSYGSWWLVPGDWFQCRGNNVNFQFWGTLKNKKLIRHDLKLVFRISKWISMNVFNMRTKFVLLTWKPEKEITITHDSYHGHQLFNCMQISQIEIIEQPMFLPTSGKYHGNNFGKLPYLRKD